MGNKSYNLFITGAHLNYLIFLTVTSTTVRNLYL